MVSSSTTTDMQGCDLLGNKTNLFLMLLGAYSGVYALETPLGGYCKPHKKITPMMETERGQWC